MNKTQSRIAVVVAAAFALAACGEQKPPAKAETKPAAEAPKPAAPTGLE
jgi:predicted small lipoprotein YifL